MSSARLALSLVPQCSLSAGKLFSGCAGASIVGRVRPRFVPTTHRHLIAAPWQCDLSHRCHCRRRRYRHCHRHCHHHRHCGHHHQGATERVLICPTALPKCRRAVQRLCWHQRCWPHMPTLRRHRTALSHRVAVAAAAVIAIAIATVATTTRAPHSDGRSPRDSAIALPEVLWNRNAKRCIAEGIGR